MFCFPKPKQAFFIMHGEFSNKNNTKAIASHTDSKIGFAVGWHSNFLSTD